MGNTPSGLPWPAVTDLVTNGATNIKALADAVEDLLVTKGAKVLGYAGTATANSGSAVVAAGSSVYTNWNDVIAMPSVTLPSLPAGRMVLLLGYAQVACSIVGNVEMGIFDQPVTAQIDNLGFGTPLDPRVPNPTTASYSHVMVGIQVTPAAGSHTYKIKAKNNTTGTWSTNGAGLIAVQL